MKHIRMMLGTLAVAGLLGFSQGVSAQENGNRDENGKIVRGPYETNGFWSNWFIGVGAGVNSLYDTVLDFGVGGLATDVTVGKWFTPSVGARVGWRGIQNSYTPRDGSSVISFDQNYFHADALWNISNALGGYKETRFWEFIPYLHFGGVRFDSSWNYAGGFGLINDFRLGKHVDFFIDCAAVMTYGYAFSVGKFTLPVSATAGFIFNLGRSNFDRHSSVTPVVVPLPFTADEYNSLKARVAELERENAALKSEVEALRNRKPETVYVEKATVEASARTFFDLNSSVISAREKAHLDYFAAEVIAKTDKTFSIKGYGDSATGSAAANDRISQARANAVKDYLVKNCGIDASRLNAVGEGGTDKFSKPISNNRTVVIE